MGQNQSTKEWDGYDEQLFEDNNMQSYQVPNSQQPHTTPIFRHPNAKNGFVGFLIDDNKQEMDTIYKLFSNGVRRSSKNPFIGYRKFLDITKRGDYEYMTYEECEKYILSFGNGLRLLLNNANEQTIGIYSANRPEWYICHMGNLSQNYRTVGLYDTLAANSVAYIMSHSELSVIICEKNKLKELFKAIVECKNIENRDRNNLVDERQSDNNNNTILHFALKYIIQIDFNERYNNIHETVDENDKKIANEYNIELLGLSEILLKGKDMNQIVVPTKNDIAYIMYTSGTTGNPKGVTLSHQSFASIVASAQREFNINDDDICLSYLPLAHIFETSTQTLLSSQGAKIAYFQGDMHKVSEDFLAIRPTILTGVPKVFNKTYEKYKAQIKKQPKVAKWVSEYVEKTSVEALRKGGRRKKIYDLTLWQHVSHSIGFDRVRLAVSGAAPLLPHIAEFLRLLLPNGVVSQGYGLTETTSGGTLTRANDYLLGHVGIPLDNAEIRLIDAQECHYLVNDTPHPQGEVQIRGLFINRYYKNEEENKKTISEDGWLSTGDIGRINPNGTLSIIDRKKNVFKTAYGEYITVERLENTYMGGHDISQIWIYGNSYKSFIVAVVAPDPDSISNLLKQKTIWDNTKNYDYLSKEWIEYYQQLVNNNVDVVKEYLMNEIKTIEKENQLKPFECIKDIYIESNIDHTGQAFTADNGLLTPTLKPKRTELLSKYVDVLKELYSKNGEPPAPHEQWISSSSSTSSSSTSSEPVNTTN